MVIPEPAWFDGGRPRKRPPRPLIQACMVPPGAVVKLGKAPRAGGSQNEPHQPAGGAPSTPGSSIKPRLFHGQRSAVAVLVVYCTIVREPEVVRPDGYG